MLLTCLTLRPQYADEYASAPALRAIAEEGGMPRFHLAMRPGRGWFAGAALAAAAVIAGCSGIPLGGNVSSAPQQQPTAIGAGQVKVALILPLSAPGNAGLAAQSMKNAAEMALAEFTAPNVQLLIKDDA